MTIVLAIMCSLFTAGCSLEPKITSGTVTVKSHVPEKKWVQLMPMMVGKVVVLIPIFHRRPEHWTITIQGTITVDGKALLRKRDLYVSRETFEKVAVGDRYTMQSEQEARMPRSERRRATREEQELKRQGAL